MHILITGGIGSGKSTLIRRLLESVRQPPCGFITEKTPADGDGGASVYIHPIRGERIYTAQNRVGVCTASGGISIPESFDRAVGLITGIPEGSIVVMDELGFMESASTRFCEAVMELLDGRYTVIAAVKAKNTPFLDEVRRHRRAKVYALNEDNRDALFETLKKLI